MTIIKHTNEGQTSGATVTGFTAAEAGLKADSTAAFYGSIGMSFDGLSTSAAGRDAITGAAKLEAVGYVRLSTLPDPSLDMYRLTETGDTTTAATIRLLASSNGTLPSRLQLLGVGSTGLWTSANAWQAATWYRLGLYLEAGTSPTTGKARLAYFLRDSNTPVEDSGLLTGVNTADALAAFGMSRLGKTSAATYSGKGSMDNWFIKTDADATQNFDPFLVNVTLDKTTGTLPYTLAAGITTDGGSGVNRTYAMEWGDGTTTGLDGSGNPSQSSPNFSKSVTGSTSFTGRVPIGRVREDAQA